MMNRLAVVLLLTCACTKPAKANPPDAAPAPIAVSAPLSTLSVTNTTGANTVVFVAFGADSVVLPTAWAFCTATARLNCSFPLKAKATQALPLAGYLNATMSFGGPVACGSTKAELNLNNPKWFDVMDVSLVDGYSNKVMITTTDASGTKQFGPPKGSVGNSKVIGLFPLGCDICVARQNPPCGMSPGKGDCKGGTQYKPDVICQYQSATKSGGSTVKVALVKE